MFEAEFSFNTSESFAKDLVVIALGLATLYGGMWLLLSRKKATDGEGD